MQTKTFFVQLMPVSRFAFGVQPQGSGIRNNYFIKSNPYPQQTGVLGFIRHQLLLQNQLLVEGETGIATERRAEADLLIGTKSFNPDQTSYGAIQYISPVFLTRNGEHFFVRNHECCEGKPVLHAHSTITNYTSKSGFDQLLVGDNGTLINQGNLLHNPFISQEQTGIRMVRKQVADDAYYKQQSFRLKSGFGFGFYVTLNETVNDREVLFGSSFAIFGKERSVFRMTVEPAHTPFNLFSKVYGNSKGTGKYLCLSDVIIQQDEIKDVLVTGGTQSFQYRTTQNTTKNHYNSIYLNAEKQQLLKRGSVLYTDAEKAASITGEKAFFNIGYNHLAEVDHQLTINL